ncbi:acetate--CoA ligase family protein [Subtercola frigoramans]|uniref:Acetyltransferase n=1 Tax=Subtercola frigoramans TaxID=120298 RepID=A0ABS2L9D0_9MICO|nr:acetate--CoA ligase family protein [Subtercola frigoramans]MBM7473697.1 acetyltransferase [Subtercola frigoramans]
MSWRELDPLFAPSGIVVVGASANPDKLGSVMARALGASRVPVSLVNSQNPASGLHASIESAVGSTDAPIDLAVLCVPASATAEVLRDSARNGIRAALVCAGGFAEAGGPGREFGAAVDAAVLDTGIRMLGPNTSGFFVPRRRLRASFVPGVSEVKPGSVAIVAASGGINHVLAFKLQRAGVGVSLGVGLGAASDVGAPDVLDYLAHDDSTKAVLLHIESVTHGEALLRAVRELARLKPVVALVVGRNDVAEFAASHTGSLATSWRTTRDLLSQAGAVIVDDEDDLVTAGTVLSQLRAEPSAALGVGLVTGQAGPGLIIADRITGAGLELPRLASSTIATLATLLPPLTFQANPVDTGRPGPGFPAVLATVAADPSIGIVAAYALTEPVLDLPAAVHAAGIDASVPVIVGIDGPLGELESAMESAREHGVAAVAGPSALATAAIAVAADARARHLASFSADRLASGGPAEAVVVPAGGFDEIAAKGLLDSIGIATPGRRRCHDRDAAQAALAELGGPVAVKLVDASVLHKSDIGGVVLGVTTSAELDTALDALIRSGAREFLVEQMAPKGVDLIVAARRDPVFGPTVVLGMGGVEAELLADVAIRTVPVHERMTDAMIDDLITGELLRGFRNGPKVDVAALTGVFNRLGALLCASPGISEIEINPLRLTGAGLIALDAVVIAQEAQ